MADSKPRGQTARKRTYQRKNRSATRTDVSASANADKSFGFVVEIPQRRTSRSAKAPVLPSRSPSPPRKPSSSRNRFPSRGSSSSRKPSPSHKPSPSPKPSSSRKPSLSPFAFLPASSIYSPVADFDTSDEDFGTPLHRESEGGRGRGAESPMFTPIVGDYDTATGDRGDTPFPDSHNSPLADLDNTPVFDRDGSPVLDHNHARDLSTKAMSSTKSVPQSALPSLSDDELSDDEEDLKGGPFSASDVEKIKAEYALFDKRIAMLAKAMGRSVRSIQKIGGVSRVVNPRKTTAWNVFQSNYPPNTDKSVSQADYTRLTVRPAYNELVQKHGGERSDEWLAESARMILEHSQANATITADIAQHGGEVAKVVASQMKAWKRDFGVMSRFGVHCELTVLTDNAYSPAAHAQNGQLFGTPEIEAYYKSRHDFKSHVGDAYTFILSAKGRAKEADEHKSRVAQWERAEGWKNPNKMKGLVANMLIKLFDPFVPWKTFPWLNLPQKLLTLNLKMEGVLPVSQFRLLGSHSIDAYNVNETRAMYDALADGQIKVLQRDSRGLDPGQTALITDCDGRVLMTEATAMDMVNEKRKRGVHKAAVRAIARAKDKGVGVDEGEDVGGVDGGDHQNLSATTSASMGIGGGMGSRKRRWEGADGRAKAKRTMKSSEFIKDSSESTEEPESGSSLQSSGLPIDGGTAVGTSSNASAAPLPHVRSLAVGPPIMVSPALPSIQPDPFNGLGQIQLGALDFMNLPLLDPSSFQGPDFEDLVKGYDAANSLGSSFNL